MRHFNTFTTHPAVRHPFYTLTAATLFAAICIACSSSESQKKSDSDSIAMQESETSPDNFDIAMAVSSITDAINVGEPLDTAEYNFEGVLTDGIGTPLYTDVQGAPGRWKISVVNDHLVRIKNIYLGDIVPDSLTKYILAALSLSDDTALAKTDELPDDIGCMSDLPPVSYRFGKGLITFETRSVFTSSGDEGPLFCITISSDCENHRRKI